MNSKTMDLSHGRVSLGKSSFSPHVVLAQQEDQIFLEAKPQQRRFFPLLFSSLVFLFPHLAVKWLPRETVALIQSPAAVPSDAASRFIREPGSGSLPFLLLLLGFPCPGRYKCCPGSKSQSCDSCDFKLQKMR